MSHFFETPLDAESHFIVDEENDDEVAQERAAYEIYESAIRHNAENRREIAAYILDSARSGAGVADLLLPFITEDLGLLDIDTETASDAEIIAGIEKLIAPRVWVRGKGYVIEE